MRIIRRYFNQARFSLILFFILITVTAILTPSRFSLGNLGTTIGLVAPLILAACAVTPVFLAGREGIDLSAGPLIGFVSVVMVKIMILDYGITSPLLIIPAVSLIGLAVGAVNGAVAVYCRVQPIVTTLGAYLILSGVATWILPSPQGPVPDWLRRLSEGYSVIPLLAVALLWLLLKRMPFHGLVLSIGSDDRAAYAAGINVNFIRFSTYLISGLIAALAALSLTGLLGSADARVGPNYTLLAIAAAALGGVSLAGGRGTMFGAAIGAIDIFLLQNLVTHFNVSSFFLQIAYGSILVIAVALNSEVLTRRIGLGRRDKDA